MQNAKIEIQLISHAKILEFKPSMAATNSKDTKAKVKELRELLSNKPKLLILVHPDPDSMASAIALRRIVLRKCSKIVIGYGEAIKRIQNRAMAHLLKIKMVNLNDIEP